MTPLEIALGGSILAGAVVVYLVSDREVPDKLYFGGLVVAVAGGTAHNLAGESWALAFAFGGLALGVAVILADLEYALEEAV
jgi:hypothetical protein